MNNSCQKVLHVIPDGNKNENKHDNKMCGMKLGNTNVTAYLLVPNMIK